MNEEMKKERLKVAINTLDSTKAQMDKIIHLQNEGVSLTINSDSYLIYYWRNAVSAALAIMRETESAAPIAPENGR